MLYAKHHSFFQRFKSVAILCIGALLGGCTSVLFTSPQPDGVKSLDAFPAEYTGLFLADRSDTIRITQTAVQMPEEQPMMINGSAPNDLIVKPFRKGIAVNIRDSTGWVVVWMRPGCHRSLVLYMLDVENERKLERLKNYTAVSFEKMPGLKADRYWVTGKPDVLEVLFRKGYFKKWVRLKRIKP